ncbi:MAG: hypothetical protein JNM52_02325, partial [Betaproteobacteria bacterium]|nr:hypothetical protein [Betaproteobacteria bacterium]
MKLMTLVLAPLLSGYALSPAMAQQATPNQAELDEAVREGRKEERPAVTLPPRKKDGLRVITAKQLDGVNQKQVEAQGDVVLKQDNIIVTTERLRYSQETDVATVPGQVRLERDGDV